MRYDCGELLLHVCGTCLPGHVTKRSRPPVPSGPLLLSMFSSSEQKKTNEKKKDLKDVDNLKVVI